MIRYIFILILLFPIKLLALIEVDITRGNLSPLPLAVSPLSIDSNSKEEFKKILKKNNVGEEISIVVPPFCSETSQFAFARSAENFLIVVPLLLRNIQICFRAKRGEIFNIDFARSAEKILI